MTNLQIGLEFALNQLCGNMMQVLTVKEFPKFRLKFKVASSRLIHIWRVRLIDYGCCAVVSQLKPAQRLKCVDGIT